MSAWLVVSTQCPRTSLSCFTSFICITCWCSSRTWKILARKFTYSFRLSRDAPCWINFKGDISGVENWLKVSHLTHEFHYFGLYPRDILSSAIHCSLWHKPERYNDRLFICLFNEQDDKLSWYQVKSLLNIIYNILLKYTIQAVRLTCIET